MNLLKGKGQRKVRKRRNVKRPPAEPTKDFDLLDAILILMFVLALILAAVALAAGEPIMSVIFFIVFIVSLTILFRRI